MQMLYKTAIVDVVDRELKSLKDQVLSLFFETKTKVKTVTIDMYEPYMSLIKQLFPNAKIIIRSFSYCSILKSSVKYV